MAGKLKAGMVRRELLGWIAALFGASAAAVAEAPLEVEAEGLMTNRELLAWCIMGAVLGALVQVLFKPPETLRDSAFKMIGSVGAAFMATPFLFRWQGWETHLENVLFAAGAVSFCAWWVLKVVYERVPKLIEKKFGGGGGSGGGGSGSG